MEENFQEAVAEPEAGSPSGPAEAERIAQGPGTPLPCHQEVCSGMDSQRLEESEVGTVIHYWYAQLPRLSCLAADAIWVGSH